MPDEATSQPMRPGPTARVEALRRDRRTPLVALAVLVLVAFVGLMWLGRGLETHYDEWTLVTQRRGISAHSLLEPHNGHFSLFPVVLYKAMLQVFGLNHHWAFRALLLVIHGLCGVLVFAYVRPRVGQVAAIAAASLVLFLGAAAEDLLWAFQIGFLSSLAGGVATLLLLGSDRRHARLGAAVTLAISLASSGIGVVFLLAAIIEVAVNRDRRRILAVLAPTVMYVAWFVVYGRDSGATIDLGNLPMVPSFAATMGGSALGGMTGLGKGLGPALIALAAIAAVLRLLRVPRFDGRMLAVLAAPLVWWTLTALSRGGLGDAHASRYVYPSVVLMLLLAAELLPRPARPLPARAVAVVAALLLIAVVGNVSTLRTARSVFLIQSHDLRAQLGALALLGPSVDPNLFPAPPIAPGVNAGMFAIAQRDFGSIADSPKELATSTAQARLVADAVLLQGKAVRVEPARSGTSSADSGPPPVATVVGQGQVSTDGSCVAPSGPGAKGLDVRVPAGQAVRIEGIGGATVRLRRFGERPPDGAPPVTLPAGPSVLRTARDDAAVPWHATVTGSSLLRVCAAR